MEYFSLLHLNREPFSNSPDPEFFFDSRQHTACLQSLEMAIRLRQGLNVVLGEVGTGKTTLCRQLIRRLDDGGQKITLFLILDPDFHTPREFLTHLAALFAIPELAVTASDREIKEALKEYLFAQGVAAEKIIVLIIDEGQKLPGFCLETLRELLNFETNTHKLLQTVIFAQQELMEELQKRPNFTDRISNLLSLAPFGFADTRRMIQHRLRHAGATEGQDSGLFSLPALWIIHRLSGGYPRKIVQLCSKTVIALIIQNKTRVSVALVRASARRLPLRKATGLSTLTKLGLPILAGLAWLLLAAPWATAPIRPVLPALPAPVPHEAIAAPQPTTLLGTLPLEEGDTLQGVITRIYGRYTPGLLAVVLEVNPAITNLNQIRAGSPIQLPSLPSLFLDQTEAYLVQVSSCDSLAAANHELTTWPVEAPQLQVIPNHPLFLLCSRQSFAEEGAAQEFINQLPPPQRETAKVVHKATFIQEQAGPASGKTPAPSPAEQKEKGLPGKA
jgi:type II secretory pathway predicted ATPase ExeA/phage tail protein X